MKRLAIIGGIIGALVIALIVALRVPGSQAVLEDLPGVGGVFYAIAGAIGGHVQRPYEIEFRLEHTPSPEALAALQRAVKPAHGELRGDRFVVTATDLAQGINVSEAFDVAMRYRNVRLFVVVYQSDELDRIKQLLQKDDQAKRLALSVELDPIGYHLHAPNGMMMVNPAWAARHHCEGSHYEGAGTSCEVTARERMNAFVHGDPDLFVDAHPDALALPAGRAFFVTDDGNGYELEAQPIEIPAAQITGVAAAGSTLELAITPQAAAAVHARANAPTVELVAELEAGQLHLATAANNGLALTIAMEASAADDLLIAGAGPHEIR